MGASHRLRMASTAAMHSVTPIIVSTANRSTPAMQKRFGLFAVNIQKGGIRAVVAG